MKGIRLVLVRILLCIASALNAQRKNHFAIHVAPQYGIDENIDYNADLSLMYKTLADCSILEQKREILATHQ